MLLENIPENYPNFGHAPPKRDASPVLGQQSLKNVGLTGGHIISLQGGIFRTGRDCTWEVLRMTSFCFAVLYVTRLLLFVKFFVSV